MRLFIHPVFWIIGAVAIIYAAAHLLVALIIAVILHELAHILTAKAFGVLATKLTLTPFGGAVNLQTNLLSVRQKNLIYLAGPMASLLLTLFFSVLVWLFPVAFGYLEYLVVANFLIGIMNLIPIYPLDGGKILANLVKPLSILIWSNIMFAVLLVVALIQFNFWLIVYAVTVLIQINWEYKSSTYYDKFHVYAAPKTGKFVRCAVLSTTTLLRAYQMVNKKFPTEFVITDLDNQVFYESDLEQWLFGNDLNTPIRLCQNNRTPSHQ